MSTNTFLPEDYLARKAERRTNFISLVLFAVVMTAVFGAFLVTNKQWSEIKRAQETINARYQLAGKQIQELTELEKQREEMLQKAELAAALVERVPRSILLAELINRMPPQLGVIEMAMKSERVQPKASKTTKVPSAATRLSGKNRNQTREEAEDSIQKVEPPRYHVILSMVGLAPTDLEVSRYLAELNAYPLVNDVTLQYSEQREIEGRTVREFRLTMSMPLDADVRQVEPLVVPRVRNPMTDEMMLTPTRAGGSVSAVPPSSREN